MIPITKDWKIVIEERQYTLKNRRIKGADEKSLSRLVDKSKAGDEYWVDVGYYRTIDQALQQFTQSEMAKSKDIQDLKNRIAELKGIILEVKKCLEIV